MSLTKEKGAEGGWNDDPLVPLRRPHQGSGCGDCKAGMENRVGGGTELLDQFGTERVCPLGLDQISEASRDGGEGGERKGEESKQRGKVRSVREGVGYYIILSLDVYNFSEVILC